MLQINGAPCSAWLSLIRLENKSPVCLLWASKLPGGVCLLKWFVQVDGLGGGGPGLACHLLAAAPGALMFLRPWIMTVEWTRKDRSPLPFRPARLKATFVFKFSSCNSPEQGQQCPHVLLILCLVCVSLSLRKCVIRGRGLYLPSDPWQSCCVRNVTVSRQEAPAWPACLPLPCPLSLVPSRPGGSRQTGYPRVI